MRSLRCVAGTRMTTASTWASYAILTYLMLYSWVVLYLELLSIRLPPSATCWGSREDCRIGLTIALWAAYALLTGSVLFYVLGVSVHGRLFGRRLTFLVGLLYNFLIVMALTFYDELYGIYVVPLACCHRLLLQGAIVRRRTHFAQRHSQFAEQGLRFRAVAAAIEATAELSTAERRTLRQVASRVERRGLEGASPGGEPLTWGAEELHGFLHAAEVALAGPGHELPWFAVDRMLIGVTERLAAGSDVEPTPHYDLIATVGSSLRHLVLGGCGQLVAFCALSMLDAALVCVAQTLLVSQLTLSATEGDRVSARWQLSAYVASYLLDAIVYVCQSRSSSSCLAKSIARLQHRVAAGMVSMNAREHALYPSGSVTATFSSDISRVDALWQSFCWALLAPMARLAIAVLYTVYLKPEVGVLALTMFPFVIRSVPQSRSAAAAAAQAKASATTIATFQNGVECQRMIWACDNQSRWLRSHLGPLIAQQSIAGFRSKHMAGLVQAYAAQFVTIFVGAHIAIFAWLAVEGVMTVPEFTAMIALFLTLSSPIRMLAGFFRTALTNAGSAQRVDEFIWATECSARLASAADPREHRACAQAPDAAARVGVATCDGANGETSTDLTVRKVTFAYPGRSKPVLRCVSLHLRAGEFAMVVGESGCGKTTLLSLLTTWLRPSMGTIVVGSSVLGPVVDHAAQRRNWQSENSFVRQESLVRQESFDSVDAREAEDAARSLRSRIAVVSQETMLLRASVHENIAFGAPGDVRRADVEWAAAAAGVAGVISAMPAGYDMELGGAGGWGLSGGQAQRLCIARALCRRPKVLLLDEATSSLDPETEVHILETIRGLRTTYSREFGSLIVVSVTHHPSTLRYADVVVVMDDGQICRIERDGKLCSEELA